MRKRNEELICSDGGSDVHQVKLNSGEFNDPINTGMVLSVGIIGGEFL